MNKRMILIVSVVLVLIIAGIVIAQSGTLGTVERQLKLGYKLLDEGKYEEAILAFQKVIEIEPRSIKAYAGLGLAQANTGDYDAAFTAIEDALGMGLNNIGLLHEAMVNIYLLKGDENGAIVYLQSITDQEALEYLKGKFPELFTRSQQGFENQVVEFVDPCFEKAIRVMLDRPEGDIWSDELIAIRSIEIWGRELFYEEEYVLYDSIVYGISDFTREGVEVQYGGIKRLDDLVWFEGLNSLDIICNQISDIEPIANLMSLQYLCLGCNYISDIDAVNGLKNLIGLQLFENEISDISPVAGLKNLELLILFDNQINDISAITNLTKLSGLDLCNNKISDISPVVGLKDLWYFLSWGNRISDISPIANLTNLEQLWLGYNEISDISPLANLTKLQDLELNGNQISDINALSGLTNLEILSIGWNPVSDISAIKNLRKLTELELYDSPIKDYSPALDLPNLSGTSRIEIENYANER